MLNGLFYNFFDYGRVEISSAESASCFKWGRELQHKKGLHYDFLIDNASRYFELEGFYYLELTY